ncbi:MAG TPA: hypothetical protein VES88_10095 [Gemmatimonadaceae bacterium]|nr:hypothetical protein [Gemmatimonadaceae bacterium]
MAPRIMEWLPAFFRPQEPKLLTVEVNVPSDANKFLLDDRRLIFDANGVSETWVEPGSYVLFWVVYGGDGQEYSIEITTPESAVWKSKDYSIVGDHDTGVHNPVVIK